MKALRMGFALLMLACGSGEPTSSRSNGGVSDDSGVSRPQLLEGVIVTHGSTDTSGRITFREGLEDVVITVKNESDRPIAGARVAYFNGEDFECFQTLHPAYTVALECFSHNSSHDLILTANPLQAVSHDEGGRSQYALRNFADWSKHVGQFQGCRDGEELDSMLTGGSLLLKAGSNFLSLGISHEHLDRVTSYVKDQMGGLVADVNVFIPSRQGLLGTSTVWVIEPHVERGEYSNDNGLDDDCDGEVDNSSECLEGGYSRICYGDRAQLVNGCGGVEEEEQCDDACVDGYCSTTACTPEAFIGCYDGNARWQDSCGSWGDTVDYCTDSCEDGIGCVSNRFELVGDDIIRDRDTGKLWMRYAAAEERNHSGGITYCNNLTLSGYAWRLPTLDELRALPRSTTSVALPLEFGGFRNDHWSSTACDDASYTVVTFRDADYLYFCTSPDEYYAVRCISDGS